MSGNKSNLRNEIDIEVPYMDDNGKKGIKRVHITFISQGIYKDYTALMQETIEAVQLGEKIRKLTEDMGFTLVQKTKSIENEKGETELVKRTRKEIAEDLKRLKDEYEDASARLNELSTHSDTHKFSLIKKILQRNGIEDKEMLSFNWWQDNVDMSEAMRFIGEACSKDNQGMEDKKKLKSSMSTE